MKLHDRTPDVRMAETFIQALTGSTDAPVHWAILADRELPRLYPRTMFGTFPELVLDLTWANQKGYGVHVVVQAMEIRCEDNKLLRTSDLAREARAVFIDWDQSNFDLTFALPPSMTVWSGRGYHAYWLLQHGQKLDVVPPTLRQLARYYGSDLACTDLARVMRVPGFYHCKAEPIRTVLNTCDPQRRYSVRQIREAHPVPEEIPVTFTHPNTSIQAFHAWSMCKPLNAGSRNRTAFSIAAEGFARGFSESDVAAVVCDYCTRAGIPKEADRVVRSARRKRRA